MEKIKNVRININLLILIYLYLPIFIFLFGWIKWYIALPIVFLSVLLIYFIKREENINNGFKIFTRSGLFWILCCMAVLVVWCVLSGQGAFVAQAGDWVKHNVILKDLVNHKWPVRYDFNNGGVLDFYIGGYLFPATVGKCAGIYATEAAMFFSVCIGLLITCVGLYTYFGCKKEWKLILICFVLITFSTFTVIMSGVYRVLCPKDVSDGSQWLSLSVLIQYSSNIVLLRWVFVQFVPTVVAMTGILLNRDKVENWGTFFFPVILYSTFCFVGMAVLLLGFCIWDIYLCEDKKRYFCRIFCWKNLCSIPLAAVLCIYILGNVLQPKPENVAMNLSFINYAGHEVLWVTFQLSWMIWCFILWKNERKNHLMYCAGFILFVLPFFSFGIFNDLVMRSSIPSLFVLCVLVMKNVVGEDVDKFYKSLLIGCLALSVVGGANELANAVRISGTYEQNKADRDSEVFLTDERGWGWQYVNWDEENSVVRWIIKGKAE